MFYSEEDRLDIEFMCLLLSEYDRAADLADLEVFPFELVDHLVPKKFENF